MGVDDRTLRGVLSDSSVSSTGASNYSNKNNINNSTNGASSTYASINPSSADSGVQIPGLTRVKLILIRTTRMLSGMVVMAFGAGAYLGLSVFSRPLLTSEHYQEFSPWLSMALALQYFVGAMGMLLAATFMHNAYKTRMRTTVVLVALVNALLQAMVTIGLKYESKILFATALALEGIPLGICYILSMEYAAHVLPGSRGLAMGLVVSSVSGGQIICTIVLHRMIWKAGIEKAMWFGVVLFSVPLLLVLPCLSAYPLEDEIPKPVHQYVRIELTSEIESDLEDSMRGGNIYGNRAALAAGTGGSLESRPLLVGGENKNLSTEQVFVPPPPSLSSHIEVGVRLEWLSLVKQKEFAILALAVMAGAGPSYGLLFVFGRAAKAVADVSDNGAARMLVILSVSQAIVRLVAGTCSDLLKIRWIPFLSWSGAKNLLLLFFASQTVATLLLASGFASLEPERFLVLTVCMFSACGAAGVLCAVLAHEVFSHENGAVAIGMLNGVFDGATTLAFTAIVIALAPAPTQPHPSIQFLDSSMAGYEAYFLLCFIISTIGSVALLFLYKNAKAWRWERKMLV
eukprot:CAMPEP_0184692232 /NCGR_PEP_ID=MMETSP0313-20130426/795_1 /TAXON_ID=2792 /ORGANISM="Porphyridium aerugineum, Strain SAG 1380-2" /LENGTH=571 /DNA_ID=CAMNT_0027150047 /DNA_START=294 /DNA_END=2009 /DNA_ORIENTATION=+